MRYKLVRSGLGAFVGIVSLLLWGAGPAVAQRGGGGGRAEDKGQAPPTTQPGSGQQRPAQESPPPRPERLGPPIRFEATFFQTEIAPERIVELDAQTLAGQGGTPASLMKALQQFGTVEVLYRIDQGVSINATRTIQTSSDVPYVSGTTTTKDGQTTRSIARERAGVNVKVFAGAEGDGPIQAVFTTLDIELSLKTDSRVNVGEGITSPVFWRVAQAYGGLTELGRPIVLVTVDRDRSGEGGKSYAFVTLVRMSAGGPPRRL